jgi:hypothetical protein
MREESGAAEEVYGVDQADSHQPIHKAGHAPIPPTLPLPRIVMRPMEITGGKTLCNSAVLGGSELCESIESLLV